jgi:hypothetical protein
MISNQTLSIKSSRLVWWRLGLGTINILGAAFPLILFFWVGALAIALKGPTVVLVILICIVFALWLKTFTSSQSLIKQGRFVLAFIIAALPLLFEVLLVCGLTLLKKM